MNKNGAEGRIKCYLCRMEKAHGNSLDVNPATRGIPKDSNIANLFDPATGRAGFFGLAEEPEAEERQ